MNFLQDAPELPETNRGMPLPDDIARELSIIHKICSNHFKELQTKSQVQVTPTQRFLSALTLCDGEIDALALCLTAGIEKVGSSRPGAGHDKEIVCRTVSNLEAPASGTVSTDTP